MELITATEIYDGNTWYRGLVPGSVKVDPQQRTVTFVVTWSRTGRQSRITLALDQVKGVRQDLTR